MEPRPSRRRREGPRKVLRAAALAATALALLATSKNGPPPSCPAGPLVPGPAGLAVDTTCGPAGTVIATVDPDTCEITLDGAAAVGLPASGTMNGPELWLQEGDAVRHCRCVEGAPGEWTVRCYELHDGNAIGCGGSDLPVCDGVVRVAAP